MNAKQKPKHLQRRYVSQQNGFRSALVTTLLALVLGLSFRLYFSSERVEILLRDRIRVANLPWKLEFQSAKVQLSRGVWPQAALMLTGVAAAPVGPCMERDAVRIDELIVPVQFWSLLSGHVQFAIVRAEALVLDVDLAQGRCESGNSMKSESASSPAQIKTSETPQMSAPPLDSLSAFEISKDPKRLLNPEDLSKFAELCAGIELGRLEIRFEKGQKGVVLKDFSARPLASQELGLRFDLRVPPEVTYGETLPIVRIEADLKPDVIEVSWSGRLSEGSVEGVALVRPHEQGLFVDTHGNLANVPLSQVMPLFRKAKLISPEIQPSFLWLSCQVSIRGIANRLFKDNPIEIEKCLIDGEAGQVSVDRATRHPDGRWAPMLAVVNRLDLRKTLRMFSVEGPSGILSDYGVLDAKLSYEGQDEIKAIGALKNLSLIFSNGNVRAFQKVPQVQFSLALKPGALNLEVPGAEIDQGEWVGKLNVDWELTRNTGKVKLDLDKLLFHPDVQKLMLGGSLKEIRVNALAEMSKDQVQKANINLGISNFVSTVLSIPQLDLKTTFLNGEIAAQVSAAEMAVAPDSVIGSRLEDIAKSERQKSDRVSEVTSEPIAVLNANARFRGRGREFRWENAQADLGKWGRLQSEGLLELEGHSAGWLRLRSPSGRVLPKWQVRGPLSKIEIVPSPSEK